MLFIVASGVPSMAAYVSLPVAVSDEPAPSLPSLSTGLTGGITGPESVSLAAEAPQGASGFGNYSGSDGINQRILQTSALMSLPHPTQRQLETPEAVLLQARPGVRARAEQGFKHFTNMPALLVKKPP